MPAATASWPARSRPWPNGRGRTRRPSRHPRRSARPGGRKRRPARPSRDAIAAWLTAKVAGPLGIRPDEVDTRRPLADFGIGSLQAVRLAAELEEWLGRKLSPTLAYDHPTIDALASFLAGKPMTEDKRERPGIGHDPEFASRSRSSGSAADSRARRGPKRSGDCCARARRGSARSRRRAGTTRSSRTRRSPGAADSSRRVDRFDADFFGISPREAALIDPQHRLLLETAWEALEDGGQVPERLAGTPVGVFVGISTNDYAQLQAMRGGASDGYRITGNAASIAANRISHHFDFRGPSLAIDTACSSSLVAVHLACRSLRDGECELALAGGVNLILLREVFASFARAGFLSPDGRCKTFDAGADGYVRGEGAGMVVLKPLSRALADGDPIYAVIRGGAVNQDGRTNGLTAPSRSAQEAVLRAAYRQAGVSPGQVDYIEAHGTGTLLGDPIELAALGSVLGERRGADRPCALGSVKTNIGHLEAAAGVAGLIKTALAHPPSGDPAEPELLLAEPPCRVRGPAAPGPARPRCLARHRAAGAGGGQLVRVRRHQCAPCPGGGTDPRWSSARCRRRRARGSDHPPLGAIPGRPLGPRRRDAFRPVRRHPGPGTPRRGLHGRRQAWASRPPTGARRLQPGRGRRGPGVIPEGRAALEPRARAKAPGSPSRNRLRLP